MKKIILYTTLLLFIVLIGWQVYQKAFKPSNDLPIRKVNAVSVEIIPVKKGNMQDIRTFTGSLSPKSKFIISPKISGRLERLFVDVGDRVKNGQLIATLDNSEYNQQINQAKADIDVSLSSVEECKILLESSKKELARAKELRMEKIISVSELESAQYDYKSKRAKLNVALAQVEQKKTALNTSKIKFSYSMINVPWKSRYSYMVIGERFVDEGAMVDTFTSIVSILDISSLKAQIDIPEKDYFNLYMGQQAVIETDRLPGKKFYGTIIHIAPMLKEESRQGKIEIGIFNDSAILKPGMFVRAKIKFDEHKNTNIIPVSALVKRDQLQGVFLVDQQKMKVKFIPVTTGIKNDKEIEITKPGLIGYVVTLGNHLLEDGAAISLPEKKTKKRTG